MSYLLYRKNNLKVALYGNFYYICNMNRRIVTYQKYFDAFWYALDKGVKRKFSYVFSMLKTIDRLPTTFVKSMGEGLFELRVEYESNIYRVFFIFDEGNIVVLFNGFQKKKQKTPKGEIDKALRIKNEYYAEKQNNSQRF